MTNSFNELTGTRPMSHPISGASLAHDAASAPTWHMMGAGEAAKFLGVNSHAGLESQEAKARARSYGPNRLFEKPPRSAWVLFFSQFKSLLILVLIFAAALAASIGSTKDAVVILAVVVLNAALGFYQEYRAEQSLAALKKMLPLKARVRRDGKTREVPAEQLVPGDIVLLEAGDRVPADGRLINREFPRLCRGGSKSLTITGVNRRVVRSPTSVGRRFVFAVTKIT